MIAIAFALIAGLLFIVFYAVHRNHPVELDLTMFGIAGLHLDTKQHLSPERQKRLTEPTAPTAPKPHWLSWLVMIILSVWRWLIGH